MNERVFKLKKRDTIRLLAKLCKTVSGYDNYLLREVLDDVIFYGYCDRAVSITNNGKILRFKINKPLGSRYKFTIVLP